MSKALLGNTRVVGFKHTEETKKLKSKVTKESYTPELLQKRSDALKGNTYGTANKGRVFSEEHRARLIEGQKRRNARKLIN